MRAFWTKRSKFAHTVGLLVVTLAIGLAPALAQLPNDPYAEGPDLPPTVAPEVVAPAAPGEQVVEVRVIGNKAISTHRVLGELQTRAGRPFKQDLVVRDVKHLATRGWFVDVKPLYEQVPGGRVVIFQVSERPTLRYVQYLGNKTVKSKKLAKETGIKVGDAVDPYAIEDGRRKIEEFYRERGFNKIEVTVIEGSKPGDQGAVYVINEGLAQKVWEVDFIGNTIASDARLKTQIQSKPPILYLFKGYVDRKKIDEDVDKLTAYYRSLGFFRARVGRELTWNEEDNWLNLTFVIDEGPRYKVRNVSFLGNKKFTTALLDQDTKLKSGEFFDQNKMNADVGAIRDIYGSQGYVFADVKADPRFLEEPGTLDLVYDIEEGDRYRVGRINVHINGDDPHTRRLTVMNRISLRTGDVVDVRELRNSERLLRASGLFESNPMTGNAPRIVFNPPGSKDTEVATKPRRSTRGQSPDPEPAPKTADEESLKPSERVSIELEPIRQPPPHGRPLPPAKQAEQTKSTINWRPPADAAGRPSAQPLPTASTNAASRGSHGPLAHLSPRGTHQPLATSQATTTTAARFPIVRGQSPGGASWPPAAAPPAGAFGGQGVGRLGPGEAANAPATVIQDPNVQPVQGNAPIMRADQPFGNTLMPGPPAMPNDLGMGFAPDPLDIDVYLQETQTGRFMIGVGVNSDAGVVGSVTIDEQNFDWKRWPTSWQDFRQGTAFRGAGQKFRVELLPGTQVQRYLISFQEPYLFDTPISFGLSGYFFDRQYVDWQEQRIGGRVSFGYQFTPYLSSTLSYRGESINVHDPAVPTPPELEEVLGDNALHGFKISTKHDTRDSAFLATEGHIIELGLEQVIGSFEYPRAELEARQYFLVTQRPDGSGRHVVSVGGRVGFSGSDTPIYDRFYAGGFSTLRGFNFRGASPRAPGGVTIGGDFMLLGSVEYLFPITADDMLRGVAFCDAGTVEEDVEINQLRVAPGVGLRITVPAMGPAPIALDFAFPVLKAEGDNTQVFSFNVGFLR